MEFLTQPKPMCFTGDLARNWKMFSEAFTLYCEATGAASKSKKIKAAILLHCIGEEAREVYRSFEFAEGEEQDPAILMAKFEAYFVPTTNTSMERLKFNMRVQGSFESFEAFVADLRKIAAKCDFGELKNGLIKDRIVCGIRDIKVKDRLLRESKLDLNKAMEICKASEATENHMKSLLETSKDMQINEMRERKRQDKTRKNSNWSHQPKQWNFLRQESPRPTFTRTSQFQKPWPQQRHNKTGAAVPLAAAHANMQVRPRTQTFAVCQRCGMACRPGQCPARGRVCRTCGKQNHFAAVCRSGARSSVPMRLRDVHYVGEQSCVNSRHGSQADNGDSDVDVESYTLGTLYINALDNNKEWLIDFDIYNKNSRLKCKLDTGAEVNALPLYIFNRMNKGQLMKINPTNAQLTGYGGTRLKVIGCSYLKIVHNDVIHDVLFYIVKTDLNSLPLLGKQTIQDMKLLTINQNIGIVNSSNEELDITCQTMVARYGDIFQGIGNIKMRPCDFKLKPNYQPVISPSRRVPFQLLGKLRSTLQTMIKDGIIKKVTEPTEFVHPIVLVRKPNDEIRICLDPQNLNKALMREHYELPTFDELIKNLHGSTIFSILDATKGFWQLKLSESASNLTTFATPFGRYAFTRLPFGVSVSPEIFHRTFTEIFEGIPGVQIYIDDMIIYADSKAKHDKILEQVFKRARARGVRFNRGKSKFALTEVKYVGHILTSEGVKIDNDRCEAIKQVPVPSNKKELSRFLGMVTFVGRFIKNLSARSSHLRDLLKKTVIFQWGPEHDRQFDDLKEALSKSPVLSFYNESEPITLSVDSSQNGIGACILQRGRPVAYASKSLSATQKGYAQIEKETLAIVFGCQRFHQYLYGRPFVVESDHKPLESIFQKPLNKSPLRLQRLRITLQNYDFCVRFKRGALLYIPDTLSRASYNDRNFDIIENDIEAQIGLISKGDISPEKLKKLIQETDNDEVMQLLKTQIRAGWPESRSEIQDDLKIFWNVREELTIINGVVVKGCQLVIPKSMRADIMEKLHYNHLGIEKTKLRARELVYWPNINNDIKNVVRNCNACLTYSNSNSREPILFKELASRPWQNVAIDLYTLENDQYLLLVDEFSKYPEIVKLGKDTSSSNVIENIKSVFSRHGKPEILYSDNGPQLVSREFEQFLKSWNILHKTSSPRYPQSNGLVERHIQTLKKLIKKCNFDKKDLHLTLLEYRNTPISHDIPSPAQLLFGRRLRGALPMTDHHLNPKYKYKNFAHLREKKRSETRYYYNRGSSKLAQLSPGQKVVVQNNVTKVWEPAVIVELDQHKPRSYLVQMDHNGHKLVRNRKFLKPAINNSNIQSNYNDDTYEEIYQHYLQNNRNVARVPHSHKSLEHRVLDQEVSQDTQSAVREPSLQIKERQVEPTLETTTRAGRLVRKPRYLKDYRR